jgi:hypothetical protein
LLHCYRCGYDWFPKRDRPPMSCPACFSHRWHTEQGYSPKDPRRKRHESRAEPLLTDDDVPF